MAPVVVEVNGTFARVDSSAILGEHRVAAATLDSMMTPLVRGLLEFQGNLSSFLRPPTVAAVRADPSLLASYHPATISTQDLLARGLGDYRRHVDMLTPILGQLSREQIHGVGRWSFDSERGNSKTFVMPAEVEGFKGMKIIQSHPSNLEQGLPRSNASILLFDASTGLLSAVIAGSQVTPVKTAAQSGVIFDAWRRALGMSEIVAGVLGGGPVAREHCLALHALADGLLSEVALYSPRNSARAAAAELAAAGLPAKYLEDLRTEQHRADVLVAATTAAQPVITENVFSSDRRPQLVFSLGPNDISETLLAQSDLVITDDPVGYATLGNAVARFSRAFPAKVVSYQEALSDPAVFERHSKIVCAPMGIGLTDVAVCVDLIRSENQG